MSVNNVISWFLHGHDDKHNLILNKSIISTIYSIITLELFMCTPLLIKRNVIFSLYYSLKAGVTQTDTHWDLDISK